MHHDRNAAYRPAYFLHRGAEDGAPVLPDSTGELVGPAARAQALGTDGHVWTQMESFTHGTAAVAVSRVNAAHSAGTTRRPDRSGLFFIPAKKKSVTPGISCAESRDQPRRHPAAS